MCLWDDRDILQYHFPIMFLYPSCERLFRNILGLPGLSIEHLLFEFQYFQQGDPLSYVKELFIHLDDFIKRVNRSYPLKATPLSTLNVYPIRETDKQPEYDLLGSISSGAKWYIADRPHLLESFTGILPLLAFDTETNLLLQKLFTKLGLDNRFLSHCSEENALTKGEVALHQEFTNVMRSKVEFMMR